MTFLSYPHLILLVSGQTFAVTIAATEKNLGSKRGHGWSWDI